jgi:hypothetical protein
MSPSSSQTQVLRPIRWSVSNMFPSQSGHSGWPQAHGSNNLLHADWPVFFDTPEVDVFDFR